MCEYMQCRFHKQLTGVFKVALPVRNPEILSFKIMLWSVSNVAQEKLD